MSTSLTEYLDTIPQGRLGIIAMKGCEELAERVSVIPFTKSFETRRYSVELASVA